MYYTVYNDIDQELAYAAAWTRADTFVFTCQSAALFCVI